MIEKVIKGETIVVDQEGLSPARGYLVPKATKVIPLSEITQKKIDILLKYTGYGTYLYIKPSDKMAKIAIVINYLTPHVALAAAKDYKQQEIYRHDGDSLYIRAN